MVVHVRLGDLEAQILKKGRDEGLGAMPVTTAAIFLQPSLQQCDPAPPVHVFLWQYGLPYSIAQREWNEASSTD